MTFLYETVILLENPSENINETESLQGEVFREDFEADIVKHKDEDDGSIFRTCRKICKSRDPGPVRKALKDVKFPWRYF